MDALPFLASARTPPGPLYVVHGDEAFLKRQVIRMLRQRALGDSTEEPTIATYQGER